MKHADAGRRPYNARLTFRQSRFRMKNIENLFERLLFTSRWLMAPIYLGLVLALVLLLVKFGKELLHLTINIGGLSGEEVIIGVLSLVDVSLIMNLIIIIIFSGYENFVSKMDELHSHSDRPEWMGHIGFSDLKLKLIGSIVAISGIELLRAFMNLENMSDRRLAWSVGLHLTFVLSGVLYAVTDRLQSHKQH